MDFYPRKYAGDPEFNELHYDRSGWGGRLQEQQAAGMNVVELSHEISLFGNGSVEGQRLSRVIHARNMRDIALPNIVAGGTASRRDVMARALRAYYAGRGAEAGNQPGSGSVVFPNALGADEESPGLLSGLLPV